MGDEKTVRRRNGRLLLEFWLTSSRKELFLLGGVESLGTDRPERRGSFCGVIFFQLLLEFYRVGTKVELVTKSNTECHKTSEQLTRAMVTGPAIRASLDPKPRITAAPIE